ncbi:hypothetical protein OROMI_020348 [Orobanche minor]
MLEAALRFKRAFDVLVDPDDGDSNFVAYFGEPEEIFNEDGDLIPPIRPNRSKVGPPQEEDWIKADVFVDVLKVM